MLSLILALLPVSLSAPPSPVAAKPAAETVAEALPDGPPVVTHHSVTAGGTKLSYTATAGMLPLKSAAGEIEARIFYVAYTLDGGDTKRPLTFAFNGGPGSASIWLHMGALGPRRVRMLPDGKMPAPPYELEDNQATWLPKTDLVFIDPVGTGYSRAAKPELGAKFWGLQGDIDSVGSFIKLYLTRNRRWTSPLYLAGESYGTTRAAGLSDYLLENGIALNGIVLISTVLNFQTVDFNRGNDLPYWLYLPTYTATAWYHHRLAPDLQRDLLATLREAEKWARTEYASALGRGSQLSDAERTGIASKLARYTGLSRQFVLNADLRIEIFRFTAELLRDQRRSVGRLDSRFTGIEESGTSETPDFDPSMSAIRPPYTSTFLQYATTDLGYRTDADYYVLGGGINSPWNWGGGGNSYADTSAALRSAFAKNPYMKLFVACGYYDLATPYYAVEYTLAHMGLDASVRPNVRVGYHRAGHMVYLDSASLAQLRDEVFAFYDAPAPQPK